MNKIINALAESKSEIDKVLFPTKPQIKSSFFNVFFMVSFISLFLLLLDFVFTSFISKII